MCNFVLGILTGTNVIIISIPAVLVIIAIIVIITFVWWSCKKKWKLHNITRYVCIYVCRFVHIHIIYVYVCMHASLVYVCVLDLHIYVYKIFEILILHLKKACNHLHATLHYNL